MIENDRTTLACSKKYGVIRNIANYGFNDDCSLGFQYLWFEKWKYPFLNYFSKNWKLIKKYFVRIPVNVPKLTDRKRAGSLLTRYYPIQKLWGLWNKILCIQLWLKVLQTCQSSNLEVWKKKTKIMGEYLRKHNKMPSSIKNFRFFFSPPNLTASSFAAHWAIRMNSVSFENPHNFSIV